MRSLAPFVLVLLATLPVWGQTVPDTLEARHNYPVDIEADVLPQSWWLSRLDSSSQQRLAHASVADWLSEQGAAFVKNYGAGVLSTLSIRGGTAAQTALVWNGLNLQSPLNGQGDWSQVAIGSASQLKLLKGGGSAQYGSGLLGGAVVLSDEPDFESGTKLSVQSAGGSWGQANLRLQTSYGSRNQYVQSAAWFRFAQMNYPVYNRANPDQGSHLMPNNQVVQGGFCADYHGRNTAKGLQWDTHIWYATAHRQLPPTLLQSQDYRAFQRDNSLRVATHLRWNPARSRWTNQFRTGICYDDNYFSDSLTGLMGQHRAWLWPLQLEARRTFGKGFWLNMQLQHQLLLGKSTGYESQAMESRINAFAELGWHSRRNVWYVVASVRPELLNGVPIVPAASLHFSCKPLKWMQIRANASRNYRLPTFNDRYWSPGGKPDLQPEHAWALDGGLVLQGQHKALSMTAQFCAFSHWVQDQIVWLPDAGYWSPRNLQKVWSRGLELEIKGSWFHKKGIMRWSSSYTLTHATQEYRSGLASSNKGKQMPYVPLHQAHAIIEGGWRGWMLLAAWNYCALRYTVNDNSDWLPGYSLLKLELSKLWTRPRWSIRLYFTVDNVSDTIYETMPWRPMPGRSYLGGLSFDWNRPISLPSPHNHP